MEMLRKAREYENITKTKADPDRPSFHLTPATGWCNDPNGFSVYKDDYHLFYQYYPYDIIWGPMHWGHVKTNDFISWDYLPAAMAPDQDYDKKGCFSGSALELDDGRHLLAYTGCYTGEQTAIDGSYYQHQCIAIGDGLNYKKMDCNPVISADLLPDEYSNLDFRDPKIIKKNDSYSIIIGARRKDNSGHSVLLFESKDLQKWTFASELISSDDKLGRLWECPDYFEIDGNDLLLFSSQLAYKNQDIRETLALLGKYDDNQKKFKITSEIPLDYGTDFYAPQTIKSLDGRRIMIGWMQNWASVDYKLTGKNFFGQMGFPRELYFKDNLLCQSPVQEIEQYYGDRIYFDNLKIKEPVFFENIEGRYYDMEVTIHFDKDPCNTSIKLRQNEDSYFQLYFDSDRLLLSGNRSKAGIPSEYKNQTEIPVNLVNNSIKLRFIVDRYSIEVFVNDGQQVASYLIDSKGEKIQFEAEKECGFDIDFHKLIRKESETL